MPYSASKAAVIGMTKVQGKEVAGTGITVNALAPAAIETPMVQALPDQQVKYMTDKIPMGRCGSLDELVAMVEFMASPGCSFTTGFTFELTGGLHYLLMFGSTNLTTWASNPSSESAVFKLAQLGNNILNLGTPVCSATQYY